jgi:hypothetical protein
LRARASVRISLRSGIDISVQVTLTVPAKINDTTITVTDASLTGIKLGYSGFNSLVTYTVSEFVSLHSLSCSPALLLSCSPILVSYE